jgi:uncharacterized lipoprotein NlpE involved in copper resistance
MYRTAQGQRGRQERHKVTTTEFAQLKTHSKAADEKLAQLKTHSKVAATELAQLKTHSKAADEKLEVAHREGHNSKSTRRLVTDEELKVMKARLKVIEARVAQLKTHTDEELNVQKMWLRETEKRPRAGSQTRFPTMDLLARSKR